MRALTTPGQLHAFDNAPDLSNKVGIGIFCVMVAIIAGRLAWDHAKANEWV